MLYSVKVILAESELLAVEMVDHLSGHVLFDFQGDVLEDAGYEGIAVVDVPLGPEFCEKDVRLAEEGLLVPWTRHL